MSETSTQLGVLLIDGFGLMAYAAIIEPFRAANMLSGRNLYSWTQFSVTGGPAQASSGASILADGHVGADVKLDTLFVIAGRDPAAFKESKTLAWLRKLARAGVRMAGVSSGAYVLAKAGLLEGYRCTIHWDQVPLFIEKFPTLRLENQIYIIDRKRLTCAGGTAGFDMSVDMIEREQGHELATQVGEWFVRTKPRDSEDTQRVSLRERYNVQNTRLLKVLAHMEETIESPVSVTVLSKIAQISPRQLERMFKTHLDASLGETYRRIRLNHADQLLRKTGMSITEVAIASGYNSSSRFSHAFKAHYGYSPRIYRRKRH